MSWRISLQVQHPSPRNLIADGGGASARSTTLPGRPALAPAAASNLKEHARAWCTRSQSRWSTPAGVVQDGVKRRTRDGLAPVVKRESRGEWAKKRAR